MYPSRIPLSQAGLVQVISIDVELVFVALTCVGGVETERIMIYSVEGNHNQVPTIVNMITRLRQQFFFADCKVMQLKVPTRLSWHPPSCTCACCQVLCVPKQDYKVYKPTKSASSIKPMKLAKREVTPFQAIKLTRASESKVQT